MDADVIAAASAAAATTRTPFDDDDDMMAQVDAYPQSHMETAPYAAVPVSQEQEYGQHEYLAEHEPAGHDVGTYASTDDPYASDVGAHQNAMGYYQAASGAGNAYGERGFYAIVPNDSLTHQPQYDAPSSTSGGASAGAYQSYVPPSEAVSEPYSQYATDTEPPSNTSEYYAAPSQASHESHYANAADTSAERAAAEPAPAIPASYASVPTVAPVNYAAEHVPTVAPVDYAAERAPGAVDEPSPPYAGPPQGVSDTKPQGGAGFVPAQLVDFGAASPEGAAGGSHAYAGTEQSHADTSEWDPPLLSHAWFPEGAEPSSHEGGGHNGYDGEPHEISGDDSPGRLVVRNPSPEE